MLKKILKTSIVMCRAKGKQAFIHLFILFILCMLIYERGSIVVRAHASRAEGLRFEPDSMP